MILHDYTTMTPPGTWNLPPLLDRPVCLNGLALVRRYRVRIELVEEDAAVVAERIQGLWEESTNHHDYLPLLSAANEIGYQLTGRRGEPQRGAEP